ncbi:hypothetical protein [Bacteroides clarus]|uniref:hypothetical protein n=1 Tax=Bacteroides clarus TaxID=626929 RepID=UPI00189F50B7|nr:hypothetical protein [Bacteroides clarus]
MENIRRYIEAVYSGHVSSSDMFMLREECINSIANKLLSMDSSNKECYVRMIASYLEMEWNYCLAGEENGSLAKERFARIKDNLYLENNLEITITADDIKSLEEAKDYFDENINESEHFFYSTEEIELKEERVWMMVEFIYGINWLFNSCNISLNDYLKVLQVPSDMMQQEVRDILSQKASRKKLPSAKSAEQVDVIMTLLNGCKVNTPTKETLAEFISWLCGGTVNSIRQNVMCKNTGYNNEEVLKEKFASIGITYEKGKIKNE